MKKASYITMLEAFYITQVAIIKGSLRHEMLWVTFTTMQIFANIVLFNVLPPELILELFGSNW